MATEDFQNRVLALHYPPTKAWTSGLLKEVLDENMVKFISCFSWTDNVPEQTLRVVLAIVCCNATSVAGRKGSRGSGGDDRQNQPQEWVDKQHSVLYERMALMSHSCQPNARVIISSESSREGSLIAIRPIASGDSITIDYLNGSINTVPSRQKLIKEMYAFWCDCEVCTKLPDSRRAMPCPRCWTRDSRGGLPSGIKQSAGEPGFVMKYPGDADEPWRCDGCSGTFAEPGILQQVEEQTELHMYRELAVAGDIRTVQACFDKVCGILGPRHAASWNVLKLLVEGWSTPWAQPGRTEKLRENLETLITVTRSYGDSLAELLFTLRGAGGKFREEGKYELARKYYQLALSEAKMAFGRDDSSMVVQLSQAVQDCEEEAAREADN
eukprot:gnl/TRDRNA2_/TRDRNA2_80198_c0_seq3.p1 gnl/TRDRNA2_/TRDRNA2_80198_c0~~gnl/TRDRNA2_/TRDRNA2_80198_c0_seq3.p1  ORF type:complete len:383 (-),score=69.31 gnl/TRDRNA2_/TRDRNA2_80198_c0_seq3:89-1237(-)